MNVNVLLAVLFQIGGAKDYFLSYESLVNIELLYQNMACNSVAFFICLC
jgi:hypothetical protein